MSMINSNTSDVLLFFDLNGSDPLSSLHRNFSSSLIDSKSFAYKNLPLVQRITIYMTFIVSVIGIIGNACTIIVLNQQTMRKWRSSILLSALAIVDFLYLFIIFLSIIDQLSHQSIGLHRSLILCQTTVYITHICSFLSASFTLSFTLQRFIAVHFPLHANTIISTRSSIINIVLLIILACSFYSFSFFLTNISQGQCREDENYPALFPLLIVDICLTFLLPFIFILLFNIAIVYKLQSRKKFANKFDTSLICRSQIRNQLQPRDSQTLTNDMIPLNSERRLTGRKMSSGIDYIRNLTHPRLSTPTISFEYVSSNSNPRQAISQRTTKMLVICSTTFLIFNSPYCAVLFYSVISKRVLTHTLDILRYFYFMSFCLNFFLYSLCGNRFRHELVSLMKRLCQKCGRPSFRHTWLHLEKVPQQSSLSRSTARTGV